MAAAAWVFRRPMRDAAHARRDVESRLQAHVHQTLTSVPVVQAFAREDDEQQRFQELTSAAIRAHQRGAFVGSAYGLGSGLVTTIGTAAVMWYAAMRVLDGRLTVGTALVFLAYLASLQWQLIGLRHDVHHAADGRRRRRSRDGRCSTPTTACLSSPARRRCRALRGEVTFEHVDFAYRPGRAGAVATSASRRSAGDVVAVVGPDRRRQELAGRADPALHRSDRRPGADRRPRRARPCRWPACASRWRSCSRSRSSSR